MDDIHPDIDFFLRKVTSKSSKCQVLEIQDSNNDGEPLEKTILLSEVESFLRKDPGEPTLKLVQVHVAFWKKPQKVRSEQFTWLVDVAAEQGIEPYLIASIAQLTTQFKAVSCGHKGREALSIYLIQCFTLGILGKADPTTQLDYENLAEILGVSYKPATRCTTCLCFMRDPADLEELYPCIIKSLKQNRRLFQNCRFMPLSLLRAMINECSIAMDGAFSGKVGIVNESNAKNWEDARSYLRVAQRSILLAGEIADCLRKDLATNAEQVKSDTVYRGATVDHAAIMEMFGVLEPGISSMKLSIEWELQRSDDQLARIGRGLMRRDTQLSIELAKSSKQLTERSIELARAAKADSNSMKVITVITMVFLPGTFFATLFAVPSLDWRNTDHVIGGNFWVYWAFTAPSTVIIIILWLAFTQSKEMRDVVHMVKRHWRIDSREFRRRWSGMGSETGADSDSKDKELKNKDPKSDESANGRPGNESVNNERFGVRMVGDGGLVGRRSEDTRAFGKGSTNVQNWPANLRGLKGYLFERDSATKADEVIHLQEQGEASGQTSGV
ncbi:uncharacterized protein F4822DRAFT_439854 [Hypoxylon trugodes]|uniref:uncharacterized protein n=1 Tax=Hypoxylon trugodes TaxID=326681 RepID=UPI0021935479|nr:uncharacterized protein F4822DRAFT_439854 [Hypoxylon trugodes]KAI1394091.1 hypothetical protein F4822DRAFT_439854 [Hypoxylon trugodes]